MVKLFCAIVGTEFIVVIDIGDDQLVGILKEAIKHKEMLDFPTDLLTLYLTKENGDANSAWLTTAHPDYARLVRGSAAVEAKYLTTETLLGPTWTMEDYFVDAPRARVLHVLVKLPGQRLTASQAGRPFLQHEAKTATDGDQSSDAFLWWWPLSYLSPLLPKTVSETKKNH